LPIVTLSAAWEQAFSEAMIGEGSNRQLALAPSKLHEFIADVRRAMEKAAMMGESPVLLTSPGIRPFVRSLIERFRPQTAVMSQGEVHAKVRLKAVGQV
jgi:flagellar biosynthesis protein FlhA